MKKIFFCFILLFFLLLPLTSCSILDSPSQIVKKYLDAYSNNDISTLRELTDPNGHEASALDLNIMVKLGLENFVFKNFHFTHFSAHTISKNHKEVIVEALYQVQGVIWHSSITIPVSTFWVLHQKNGRWYINDSFEDSYIVKNPNNFTVTVSINRKKIDLLAKSNKILSCAYEDDFFININNNQTLTRYQIDCQKSGRYYVISSGNKDSKLYLYSKS